MPLVVDAQDVTLSSPMYDYKTRPFCPHVRLLDSYLTESCSALSDNAHDDDS